MRFNVFKVERERWRDVSEVSHAAIFGIRRPAALERIDFALVAHDMKEDNAIGYVTCREYDAESLYWQYGGACPNFRGQHIVAQAYRAVIDWCREAGYHRITTLVESENVRYLKLAMAEGFRIIGCRTIEGTVLAELKLDLKGVK